MDIRIDDREDDKHKRRKTDRGRHFVLASCLLIATPLLIAGNSGAL
jgi:hypothetical protein